MKYDQWRENVFCEKEMSFNKWFSLNKTMISLKNYAF